MYSALSSLSRDKHEAYIRSLMCRSFARMLDPVRGLPGIHQAAQAELEQLKGLLDAEVSAQQPAMCGACTYLQRQCPPNCRVAAFFPTRELYVKGLQAFGNECWGRLVDTLGQMQPSLMVDTNTGVQAADPAHGALALVRALLGQGTSSSNDTMAFLCFMLRTPVPGPEAAAPVNKDVPEVAAPTPGKKKESKRKPACGACAVIKRACTETCIYKPFFPPERMSEFQRIHNTFRSSREIKILVENRNSLTDDQIEEAIKSLSYEANIWTDGINRSLPSLDNLLRELVASYDLLDAMKLAQAQQQEQLKENKSEIEQTSTVMEGADAELERVNIAGDIDVVAVTAEPTSGHDNDNHGRMHDRDEHPDPKRVRLH